MFIRYFFYTDVDDEEDEEEDGEEEKEVAGVVMFYLEGEFAVGQYDIKYLMLTPNPNKKKTEAQIEAKKELKAAKKAAKAAKAAKSVKAGTAEVNAEPAKASKVKNGKGKKEKKQKIKAKSPPKGILIRDIQKCKNTSNPIENLYI